MEYKDKKILIVGLGRSGLAAAKFLALKGAKLTLTDQRGEEDLRNELRSIATTLRMDYYLGSHPAEIFIKKDLIVVSPGVSFDIEGLQAAKKNKIPVVCEMELGLLELANEVIAITGTNGKSTTTELVGRFLKEAGNKVWVGGNLGTPLISEIEEAKKCDFTVLEVSSYQLEITPSIKPKAAIWLNATPDHLDRYKTFNDYVLAKSLIGKNQTSSDWIVFNADDSEVFDKVKTFKSSHLPFSVHRKLKEGAWFEGEELVVKNWEKIQRVNISESHLVGLHNKENIAAASQCAMLFNVTPEEIINVLKKFRGLPHRLQFVDKIGGVEYYNDSKATNVGAVLMSLQSFSSPVVLIAGGLDKKTGYGAIKEVVSQKVKQIVAIGEAAPKIKEELGGVTEVSLCSSMQEAVEAASKFAGKGEVVLLSPACASFDMYRNYEERGADFVKCVRELVKKKERVS